MNNIDIAKKIITQRYAGFDAAFLCGSRARNTHKPQSDIDLVLVWQDRDPKRESFLFDDIHVEAFLHDLHSLNLFFEKDRQRGRPSLAHMISDSIDLKPGIFSYDIREIAQENLTAGPPAWTPTDIIHSRYLITDLINDLEDAEDHVHQFSIAAPLYQALFTHHQRTRGHWDAKGKHLAQALHDDKTGWGTRFITAFENLYQEGSTREVTLLTDWELERTGGRLYTWSENG